VPRTEGPQQKAVAGQIMVKARVKVNFTLEQATKAQRGSGVIALLFL
jgi:hypothetical protein